MYTPNTVYINKLAWDNFNYAKIKIKDILLIGDFNCDTYTSWLYQLKIHFILRTWKLNLYKPVDKRIRIKQPSNSLLYNINSSILINIDSCKSGILTNNLREHLFVFGVFNNLKINNDITSYKIRKDTENIEYINV